MNLPEYSLRNRKVVWFLLLVLLLGGAASFVSLEKKEDALFVIKSAMLVCSYPGATPRQVEQLVTEPIEREVQGMRAVHKVTSESGYGRSKILVELDPATRASEIPQLWDELRRRVLDVQPTLPDGVSQIRVADDFGDVYGIYYGLSADEGFSWSELREWAQRIKRELVTVDGVQKVTLFGEQQPVVNLYVSLAALANFSIRPETIVATIAQQNALVESGQKRAGSMEVRLLEEGTYRSLEDIADQLLISSTGKQYRLGDVARVERGYASPPQSLMRVNGRRAVGIGVSTEAGVDVVRSGLAVGRVLDQLQRQMPVGMELTVLYPEDRIAREANAAFALNLAESLAIVIAVIMVVMGVRAGALIGSSLLFSIGGTLLLMRLFGEGLNRTSLAGFIIAMGMLVDNAIVVTDNARQAMRQGVGRVRALVDGANAPPLEHARGDAHRHLLLPAALHGPLGRGRNRQAALRRARPVAAAQLAAGFDRDAAPGRTGAARGSGTGHLLRYGLLPPLRPAARCAAAPPLERGGDRRGALRPVALGDGAHAPEFLSRARQTLFPGRRAAARGLRHPRYGTGSGGYGALACGTARGEERLGDDGRHAPALLSGQRQRDDEAQLR